MMATSQPIALPVQQQPSNSLDVGFHGVDDSMNSFSASLGAPFNPADYTRHFLGSPISWRAGSLSARFPSGSPSAQLFSSLDQPKTPPPDVLNAFNVFDREGELCRNYTCCGIHLRDLHALLEHFEDIHVRVVDPSAPPQIHIPFNPVPQVSQPQPAVPIPQPAFDADDMELDLDLDNSTQPLRPPPQNSPLAYPQYHSSPPYSSKSPSPNSAPHILQPVNFPHTAPRTPAVLAHPEEAFNSYARFAADYSSHMPGAQPNASGGEEILINSTSKYTFVQPPPHQPSSTVGIPPALLFASSGTSGAKTVPSSASVSPTVPPQPPNKLRLKVRGAGPSHSSPATPSVSASSSTPTITTSTAPSTPAHTPPHTPLPTTASMLLSKPFRCPKPNCNKSYKQANGLKYHITHGSCNFAPPKDLEHVKDLLEMKRREREAAHAATNGGNQHTGLSRSSSLSAPGSGVSHAAGADGGMGDDAKGLLHPAYGELGAITETELREVEREAEKRLRPFACGVGDCQRRYKNMNGLRYHYQHSGEHGAVGLQLLAGGLHECLTSGIGSMGGGQGHERNGSGDRGREGEKKRAGGAGGVPRTRDRDSAGSSRSGSVSVPVSRAGSISRVGTPQPQGLQQPTQTSFYTSPSSSLSGALGNGGGLGGGTRSNGASPPLTPLTAAVQSMGIKSVPHSPTHASFSAAQQQQQHGQWQSQPSTPALGHQHVSVQVQQSYAQQQGATGPTVQMQAYQQQQWRQHQHQQQMHMQAYQQQQYQQHQFVGQQQQQQQGQEYLQPLQQRTDAQQQMWQTTYSQR